MVFYYTFYLNKKVLGLIISLFFLFTSIEAQHSSYVLKQYTSENGLPQNTVKSIKFDKNGFCWLATEIGIVRFDNKNFKTYGSDIIKGMKSERIIAMMCDTAGNIYAQTLDYKNIKISNSTTLSSFVPVVDTTDINFVAVGYLNKGTIVNTVWESMSESIKIPVIKEPAGLRNGDVYLFYGNDAYFIRKTKAVQLPPYSSMPIGNLILHDRIYLQVWTNNHIKYWIDGVGKNGNIDGDIVTNKEYLSGNFKTLWCEEGAFIYAGTSLYQIIYEEDKIKSRLVISDLHIDQPVSIAYQPSTKTYFIGTHTQGLFTVKMSDFIYPSVPKESGPENYYAIAKTSTDEVIVGDAVVYPNNTASYLHLINRNTRAMYTDSLDRVYYESEFRLSRYDHRKKKIEHLGALDNRLMAIVPVSEDSTLLFCTHTSLYKVTMEGDIIWQKHFPNGEKATGLLPLKNEQYLLPTSVGLKWYDIDKNEATKSILDSFYIRTVYKDAKDRLWIGTDGKGSFLYTENKLYPLPLGPRSAFKSIHSFIEYNKNFWLPTNNGLYKVSVEELFNYATGQSSSFYWFTLNKENGLRTNEFNGGAHPTYQWLSDGALVLPSLNGLVKFYPDKLNLDYPKEKIFIDEIVVDGRAIHLNQVNAIVKLLPTFQTLSIKVACPYFGNSENLKLEYKIGSDTGLWSPVSPSGIITINTLPANEYTLVVRKAGSQYSTPNGSISLSVHVAPFFYQTGWFLFAALFFVACLVYFFVRRRIKKLKIEKQKIEKIVEDRTRELSTAIQQLENSEVALKQSNQVKEQVIATVLHDLRSPIFYMGIASKKLIKNWNKNNQENFSQVKNLNHSISELSRFTDQFFSWAVGQQNHFKVNKSHFPLQQLFDEIEALYKEILRVNNNVFWVEKTNIECYTDKQILLLVIRNLVDNANKNTEGGSISIKAEQVNNHTKIYITDTGKGLNAFQIENFISIDKAVKNGRMGSVIITEMLRKIDGELSVNSVQGDGATFTICLS